MNIVSKLNEWQMLRKSFINQNIGFVPTMGHLHVGHLTLCKRSQQENEITVVSIFVNPTQFNQSKDFECYPRTVEQDVEALRSLDVDYVFLPTRESLYPDHFQIQITETELSRELEGEFRPGHFTGMLTIVLKLFNLVQPHRAYFGEKDYQQLLLIKKMVDALFLPIEIVACQTVRATDGLALSSRNSRLNAEQRRKAVEFATLLKSPHTTNEITSLLNQLGFKVDYIAEKWQRRLGAVWLDEVRLIDNVSLEECS